MVFKKTYIVSTPDASFVTWTTPNIQWTTTNIIGLEYCHLDDACMPLDQSAVDCCLWLLHAKFAFGFGALNNAIRSMGSVSALAR